MAVRMVTLTSETDSTGFFEETLRRWCEHLSSGRTTERDRSGMTKVGRPTSTS